MANRGSPFAPNPLLGSLISLAPAIVLGDNLARSLGMGLGIALTAILVAALSVLMRDRVPERLRDFILLSFAGIVAGAYSIALRAWAAPLASSIGIFLPLVALSGIVMQAVERSRRKDYPGLPATLRSVFGYLAVLILVAVVRELLGAGSLSLPAAPEGFRRISLLPRAPLVFLSTPAGGFILLGLLASAWRAGIRSAGRIIR